MSIRITSKGVPAAAAASASSQTTRPFSAVSTVAPARPPCRGARHPLDRPDEAHALERSHVEAQREGAADSRRALDRDVAAQHVGEALRDREAEPGAAEAAGGGRIGLPEG